MSGKTSMRCYSLLVTAILALAGCVSPFKSDISPVEAIVAAQERPITGVFRFRVQATGAHDRWIYLNSELDYRDQRNLSIELTREASEELTRLFKEDPRVFFKGKLIRIHGTAQRVKIRFTFQEVVTDKFYYQTHVRVTDASQITVLE